MIKRGCIARCGIGLLGLVTSERKEMTRYGVEAWIGIQLSPDRAGQEWCSKNPTFVYPSIEYLLEDLQSYEQEDEQNESRLYDACVERGLIDEVKERELAKAGADMRYDTSELIKFLVANKGPHYCV